MTLVPFAVSAAPVPDAASPLLSSLPGVPLLAGVRTPEFAVSQPAFLVALEALVAQVAAGPDPVRPALELSRLTVTRMAEELGIPRATLAAYRLGTRRMPVAGRARLGAYLAAHAAALSRVARVLTGEAERACSCQGAPAPGSVVT